MTLYAGEIADAWLRVDEAVKRYGVARQTYYTPSVETLGDEVVAAFAELSALMRRASVQPKGDHKDWCPVNGTVEGNTLGDCSCGASVNEPSQ